MDIKLLREQFPALKQKIRGHDFVYLDSAATALKPKKVIDRITQFYSFETANVHRGAHFVSDQTTRYFEDVRKKVQKFLAAPSVEEIIFTSGTTDSLNLLAQTISEKYLKPGDEILLSEMEHHSNIVPWQLAAEKHKAQIQFIKADETGEIDFADFTKKLNTKTRVVSITQCSNVLGTVNDIRAISEAARKVNAIVVVDAAQSVTFQKINVGELGCDFLVFSGHKLYGPYGIGVLWGKKEILNNLPPYRGGGSMIREVTTSGTTYLESPHRFEAGTPNISGVIGLGEAIDFVQECDLKKIQEHDRQLHELASGYLNKVSGLKLVGNSKSRVNLISFIVDGIHASDLGQVLDQQGIAVRTGHHCAQPLMKRMGVSGTLRVSFGVYNTEQDIEKLLQGLKKATEMFK